MKEFLLILIFGAVSIIRNGSLIVAMSGCKFGNNRILRVAVSEWPV
jgi:hypothetical protein